MDTNYGYGPVCDYGHRVNSFDYVRKETVLTHVSLNHTPTRNLVFHEYGQDKKITAIKVLRDSVVAVTGVTPSLKETKDRVEAMFAEWDSIPATRSTAAQERIDAEARNARGQRVKDAVWSAAFISLSVTEAARVADKLGL